MFATAQFGQVLLFLGLAAIFLDLVQAEVGHGAVGQPHRRRRPADLFHHDAVREVAHIGAAVLLVDGDAQQAHVAKRAPQVLRKCIVAIDLGGARRDLLLAHLVDRVAEHVQFFA